MMTTPFGPLPGMPGGAPWGSVQAINAFVWHQQQQIAAAQAGAAQSALIGTPAWHQAQALAARAAEDAARQAALDAERDELRTAGATCQLGQPAAAQRGSAASPATAGRGGTCGVPAAGRCVQCRRTFCETHRGLWGDHYRLTICVACRGEEIERAQEMLRQSAARAEAQRKAERAEEERKHSAKVARREAVSGWRPRAAARVEYLKSAIARSRTNSSPHKTRARVTGLLLASAIVLLGIWIRYPDDRWWLPGTVGLLLPLGYRVAWILARAHRRSRTAKWMRELKSLLSMRGCGDAGCPRCHRDTSS